jgi:hypothetical protein
MNANKILFNNNYYIIYFIKIHGFMKFDLQY